MNSWKPCQPASLRTCVRTGSSHIGSTRAATPSARRSSSIASVSRAPSAQAARAAHAERQVAVAEVEPHVVAQLAQAVHHVERVAGQAPAALVDQVGEPERDEVGVGRDVGAVDLDVVAGVGDHGELVADDVEQPAGELGAAGTAGEQDYHSSSGRPVRRIPACVL